MLNLKALDEALRAQVPGLGVCEANQIVVYVGSSREGFADMKERTCQLLLLHACCEMYI